MRLGLRAQIVLALSLVFLLAVWSLGFVTLQITRRSAEVSLLRSERSLARALVPTDFSQKWMSIEPKQARVARVSPFVMPVDGIVPVGTSEWLDTDSGSRLLLIYVDRPARIRGEIVHEGRSLRFDITAADAGYLWVRQPEQSGDYTVVPRPQHLVLTVVPNT